MGHSKKFKNLIKSFLNRLPYVRTLHKIKSNSKFPAGHYYSTVVSLEDIRERQDEIWNVPLKKEIPGLELNVASQVQLVEELKGFYLELPFSETREEGGTRYYYRNSFYSYTDAIILYSLIRRFKPRRIFEVGSGYSSAVMLDTSEEFFDGKIDLKFIEPYAEDRLENLIGNTKKVKAEIIRKNVQKIPLTFFKKLESGDILFIDSTHSVKTGSDVNYILFEILPILTTGVLIHFHDIHFPFEYPREWVLSGFGWNETYFLKAFLMYNKEFEIILFSDYLHKFHQEIFSSMPLTYRSTGSNLWLVRK